VNGAVIEVEAKRHHPLEVLRRCMNVRNSRLPSPGAETRHVAPSSDRDRQILMPRKVPVRAQGVLVSSVRAISRVRQGIELEPLARSEQSGEAILGKKPTGAKPNRCAIKNGVHTGY
jgi:hypothetical protein